jgi:hypothetical protein
VLPRYGVDELWYVPQNACAVSEQPVRTPALAHARRAWHGKYIPSCVEGVAGRYEGPAVLGRLHDHNGPGKPGYDAVPGREAPSQGRLSKVVLGDQGPVTPDGLEEGPVTPGVDDREAAGHLMKVYLLSAWTIDSVNSACSVPKRSRKVVENDVQPLKIHREFIGYWYEYGLQAHLCALARRANPIVGVRSKVGRSDVGYCRASKGR